MTVVVIADIASWGAVTRPLKRGDVSNTNAAGALIEIALNPFKERSSVTVGPCATRAPRLETTGCL